MPNQQPAENASQPDLPGCRSTRFLESPTFALPNAFVRAHIMVVELTVDEFVKTKVLPEHQALAAELRALFRKNAPRAREVMSYGLPMYVQTKSAFAWLSPNQKGISVGFRAGVELEDRYGLLRGTVKHARHVQVGSVAELNKPALTYYIKQALKLEK